ncbi:substrate binding domain-containing protein [Pseudomonas putida]|uniref:substrate binding domain-containing protein n=1 Tax=Pseudomonas putida TaxID=303 RepID=UPI003906B62E
MFQVDEAEAEARAGLEVLTGVLRIRSIMGAGSRLLMPAIANCRKKHPQVRFDLSAGKRMPNFIEEDIDLAILIADHLEDSANVCQRLGVVSSILCASPDYVERFGSPRTPGEILKHESLLLGTPDNAFNRWRFSVDDKDQQTSCRMAHMEVDTLDDLMSALEAGMGVGMLPECIANKAITQGSLTRILPEYTSDLTVYAVYPSKRYLDPKVKALIDCTRSLLSQ